MNNNIELKQCIVHYKYFPDETDYFPATPKYFYYQKEKPKSYCKKCQSIKSKEWERNNIEKRKIIQDKYNATPLRKQKIIESGNVRRSSGLYLEWQRNNRDLLSAYNQNRKAMMLNLPYSLTEESVKFLVLYFENECALTSSKTLVLDHFIPLSWGHGGSYIGNIVPLDSFLNHSKLNINPFEWIKKKDISSIIDKNKWNKLIKYLAKENKMNTKNFRDYVYWCEENKRTLEEVKEQKGLSSIQLWKKGK